MNFKKSAISLAALAAATAASFGAQAGSIHEYGHIVVIYQENHSFDNLYGLWGDVNGKRVNGLPFADFAHSTQARANGVAYSCLLQNDVNLTSPTPLTASCADNTGATPFASAFRNKPFKIDDFIKPTDTTCASPYAAFAANGFPKGAGVAGGCTRDLVHRFYNEQYQIDGGKQDRYVTGSDAAGLSMGVYDTRQLPLYQYLHGRQAPNYVIADNFFQAAFGGSFLNHQWLIAARTPVFAGAPNDGLSNDLHSELDANLMPTNTPLYVSPRGASFNGDRSLTQSCAPAATRAPKQGAAVCGDFAVNTTQPWSWPYSPGTADARRLPPLTYPTIGDRLTAKGVDWAWYSGGWDNAEGNTAGLGWTNGSGGTCADTVHANPQTIGGKLRCPDKLFQYHHQAFNYFANYAPGTAARAAHLRDEADFIDAAQRGRLKAVSFIKPLGPENEHPGYAGEAGGSSHLVDLVKAIVDGPNGRDTLIVITYDEFGGSWDHVPPPSAANLKGPSDVWGPGTRIPAIVISRRLERSGIDHASHDTTSILKLIEERFRVAPLGDRDAKVNSLSTALMGDDEHGRDDRR